MVNPDGTPREYRVTLYRKGTAGTIAYTSTGNPELVGYTYKFRENHPSQLTVRLHTWPEASDNLVSSSCAMWSDGVIGALQQGDLVQLEMQRIDTGAWESKFYGEVLSIRSRTSGVVELTCSDFLQKLESSKSSAIIYKSYADMRPKAHSDDDGYINIEGITETDILAPFAYLAFANGDTRTQIGNDGSTGPAAESIVTGPVAQSFIMSQDALLGLYLTLGNPNNLTSGTVRVSLQANSASGEPSGTDIRHVDLPVDGTLIQNFSVNLTSSSEPLQLAQGARYWLVLSVVSGTLTDVTCKTRGPTDGAMIDSYLWKSDGVSWAEQASAVLYIALDTVAYQELEASDYVFDDANDRAVITGKVSPYSTTQSYVTPKRGLVSYYYGKRTLEEVCRAVLWAGSGLVDEISTNLDRELSTYALRGKSLGDSLRELLDLYETSGPWYGRQHVMASYINGSGYQACKVGRRLDTSDAAAYVISNPLDSANKDEWLVNGEMDLRKYVKGRYCKVIVYGKDLAGDPIAGVASDEAAASSYFEQMDGMGEVLTVQDEDLHTIEACQDLAWRYEDYYAFGEWEGTIPLAQHQWDLMDLDPTSETFGSGKILQFNWSPLGIASRKFKVLQVEIDSAGGTVITVSNPDVLIDNRTTKGYGRMDKSDSFAAQVGTLRNVHADVFLDQAITTSSALYMEIDDNLGNPLSGSSRVKCERYISRSRYNMRTYSAVFPAGNGYSSFGVMFLKLYDAPTGGSLIGSFQLFYSVNGAYVDKTFDKWRSTRVVAAMRCKNS